MTLRFTPLHDTFAASATLADGSAPSLRTLDAPALLESVRTGMDEFGVLVFHNQQFSGSEQIAFAKRLDGEIHAKTGARVLGQNRYGNEALTDISNVGADDKIMDKNDRRRLYGLANRLWHTDASFENPRGRYSMLFARVLPEDSPATQFADMRAAYRTLPADLQQSLLGLKVLHSIAYSRQTLGFEFSAEEAADIPGAVHPLILALPRTGERSLYLASHAASIEGWNLPEARLLLRELMEHATREANVFSHAWQPGDLVIWDNRVTMHRARPFADASVRRELTRVTTLDVAEAARAAA